MNFVQSFYLYWLLFLPVLWGLFLLIIKRRHKKMQSFVSMHLISEIVGQFSFDRHRRKDILIVCVVVFSIIALARPQWGFEWVEVKREGLDILVVMDVSKSMLTQDVKPNRLERTKFAVKDLVKSLKGDRIGLIAFAGEAFMMCPLTSDYGGFLMTLDELDIGAVSRGGTDIEKALEVAIEGYEDVPSKHKAVILITDGDNLEGNPMLQAKMAKEKNIKLYTVGVGTQGGDLIQIINSSGERSFLKDKGGNYVKSRLQEKLLRDIALETKGAYVRSNSTQFGLDLIYERELSKLEKRSIATHKERRFYERFQLPLALALILLVIESCIQTRRNT